jgi:hypothetical protein
VARWCVGNRALERGRRQILQASQSRALLVLPGLARVRKSALVRGLDLLLVDAQAPLLGLVGGAGRAGPLLPQPQPPQPPCPLGSF